MKSLALIVLIGLAGTAGAATKVYQWTDENGVINFSNHPPPESVRQENDVTERTVEEAPKPGSVAPVIPQRANTEVNSEAEGTQQASIDPAEERRRAEAEREARCERGKRMVAMIEPAERVQVQHPDGRVEWLYGDDRIAELQRARKMVEDNCP